MGRSGFFETVWICLHNFFKTLSVSVAFGEDESEVLLLDELSADSPLPAIICLARLVPTPLVGFSSASILNNKVNNNININNISWKTNININNNMTTSVFLCVPCCGLVSSLGGFSLSAFVINNILTTIIRIIINIVIASVSVCFPC